MLESLGPRVMITELLLSPPYKLYVNGCHCKLLCCVNFESLFYTTAMLVVLRRECGTVQRSTIIQYIPVYITVMNIIQSWSRIAAFLVLNCCVLV